MFCKIRKRKEKDESNKLDGLKIHSLGVTCLAKGD